MKYGNEYYLELPRIIFDEECSDLSVNAKWLYVVMKNCEQKYTGKGKDYFYRSNEDLAKDCGFSMATLKRAKKELVEHEPQLFETWQSHFNREKGLSKERISVYRIY